MVTGSSTLRGVYPSVNFRSFVCDWLRCTQAGSDNHVTFIILASICWYSSFFLVLTPMMGFWIKIPSFRKKL